MFDVRLRLAGDDGSRGRVLPTLTAAISGYSAPALRFTVSEQVAGKLDAPFLVLAEYSTGGPYQRPRNDLFMVDEDSADSIDDSGAVSFTASNVFGWLAARYPIWWRPGDSAELQRGYTNQTPGVVLRDLINWAKAEHGWGPKVTTAFSNTVDSSGAAWTDRVSQSWPLFTTSLARVIDGLSSQGYIETWTEGFALHAVNAGTGADRSDTIVLGGPGFSRAPAKRVFDPATAIVVQYDGGWTHFENPGADRRFGNVFKVMSQTGAPDIPAAGKNVQPALTESRAMQEELSYEWVVADGTPRPWVDFTVGDLVTARTRRGKKLLRVIGLDVSKDTKGQVTARAVVGSKILDLQAKLAKRTSAATTGTIIGGSGATPPPVSSAPTAAPVPPSGLHAESNVGSWRPDGTAVSTVELAWLEVTQAVDGSTVDVDVYEVWARLAAEAPSMSFRTSASTVSTDAWEPGVTRYVMVRARSRAGVWSDFSPEIAVTPAVPASIVPKAPTKLQVESNTGAFQADGSAMATVMLSWSAVTHSVDDAPVKIAAYEVTTGNAVQRVTGTAASFTLPSSSSAPVSVRALTTLDVWGDPALLSQPVIGAAPAALTVTPATPTLTPGMGGVAFRWSGLSSTGAAMPAGFGWVAVETGPSATGPWTPLGATLSAAGGGSVAAMAGTTLHFRFRAFDALGRAAGTSAVVSATAQGVPTSQIPGLEGDLDEIRSTADGKNRIYVSIAEPARDRGQNHYYDPTFTNERYSPWTAVGGGIERTGTATQGGVYVEASEISVAPGDRFQVSATRLNLAGATGSATIYAQRKSAAGVWAFWASLCSLTAAGTVSGPWVTVPADTTAVRFGFYTEANMPATTRVRLENVFIEKARSGDLWLQLDTAGSSVIAVKVWNGTTWTPQVLYADSVLAAESVTAPLIKAGEIQVNHVSPSFGADLQISANSAVTILVGRADDQASSIAALSDGVESAQSTATSAASAAGTAQAAANGAQVAAEAAGTAASDVRARLDQHQTYYRFGTTGLSIGDPNTNAELRLQPDAIQMAQNNVVVAEWVGGVFISPEARLQTALIGNHQWLPYGAGRTIVRPV